MGNDGSGPSDQCAGQFLRSRRRLFVGFSDDRADRKRIREESSAPRSFSVAHRGATCCGVAPGQRAGILVFPWSSCNPAKSERRSSAFCLMGDSRMNSLVLPVWLRRSAGTIPFTRWWHGVPTATSPPHRTVEEMAAAYIKGIKAVQPAGPYFVLGECFSAPVAYETARQLRLGNDAVFLGLLDARMRRHWYYKILGSKLGARVRLCLTLIKDSPTWIYLKEGTATHTRKLRSLPWGERLPHVAKHIVKAVGFASEAVRSGPAAQPQGNIKPNVAARTRSNFRLRASRAYGLAVRAYLPRPYPGRICIIANEEWCRDNPTLGWSDHRGPGRLPNSGRPQYLPARSLEYGGGDTQELHGEVRTRDARPPR